MRLYELRTQMPNIGSVRTFYGSEQAAKSSRANQIKQGFPRKYHEVIAQDIPTNKNGLIDWLNSNAGRPPRNAETEATAS